MDDESYKCVDGGKDLRLHTKEELEKCMSGMSIKEKEMENGLIELERGTKELTDWLKSILDNTDKENPVYGKVMELHEEFSRLNSRLSEFRPGKFTIEDCMGAMKEYQELGVQLKKLQEKLKDI